MDTVIVFPEPPDRLKEMARELLALTDQPLQVEFVMWPEQGFRIPEDLYAKYVQHREGLAGSKPDESPDLEQTNDEVPVRKKPGRPKKVQGGQ